MKAKNLFLSIGLISSSALFSLTAGELPRNLATKTEIMRRRPQHIVSPTSLIMHPTASKAATTRPSEKCDQLTCLVGTSCFGLGFCANPLFTAGIRLLSKLVSNGVQESVWENIVPK